MKVLRRVLVSHFYGVLLGGLSGLSKTKIFDVLVITSLMVNYFSTGFNEETVYYSPGGGGGAHDVSTEGAVKEQFNSTSESHIPQCIEN